MVKEGRLTENLFPRISPYVNLLFGSRKGVLSFVNVTEIWPSGCKMYICCCRKVILMVPQRFRFSNFFFFFRRQEKEFVFKFTTPSSQLLCSLFSRWAGTTQSRSYVKIRLLCSVTAQKSVSLVNASKKIFQTGQNSHLAVEPAAPAVLCWEKHADYFKYGAFYPSGKIYFFLFYIIQLLWQVQSMLTLTALCCLQNCSHLGN